MKNFIISYLIKALVPSMLLSLFISCDDPQPVRKPTAKKPTTQPADCLGLDPSTIDLGKIEKAPVTAESLGLSFDPLSQGLGLTDAEPSKNGCGPQIDRSITYSNGTASAYIRYCDSQKCLPDSARSGIEVIPGQFYLPFQGSFHYSLLNRFQGKEVDIGAVPCQDDICRKEEIRSGMLPVSANTCSAEKHAEITKLSNKIDLYYQDLVGLISNFVGASCAIKDQGAATKSEAYLLASSINNCSNGADFLLSSVLSYWSEIEDFNKQSAESPEAQAQTDALLEKGALELASCPPPTAEPYTPPAPYVPTTVPTTPTDEEAPLISDEGMFEENNDPLANSPDENDPEDPGTPKKKRSMLVTFGVPLLVVGVVGLAGLKYGGSINLFLKKKKFNKQLLVIQSLASKDTFDKAAFKSAMESLDTTAKAIDKLAPPKGDAKSLVSKSIPPDFDQIETKADLSAKFNGIGVQDLGKADFEVDSIKRNVNLMDAFKKTDTSNLDAKSINTVKGLTGIAALGGVAAAIGYAGFALTDHPIDSYKKLTESIEIPVKNAIESITKLSAELDVQLYGP